MRDLLLRLRHWMIEALGGYTRQHIFTYRNVTHIIREKPICLESRIDMTYDMIYARYTFGNPETAAFELAKREMARYLAQKMVEEGVLLFDCKDNPYIDGRTYRARAYLISPRDAAKLNQGGT